MTKEKKKECKNKKLVKFEGVIFSGHTELSAQKYAEGWCGIGGRGEGGSVSVDFACSCSFMCCVCVCGECCVCACCV